MARTSLQLVDPDLLAADLHFHGGCLRALEVSRGAAGDVAQGLLLLQVISKVLPISASTAVSSDRVEALRALLTLLTLLEATRTHLVLCFLRWVRVRLTDRHVDLLVISACLHALLRVLHRR